MLGLLPALRIVKELEQRTPRGDREQEPIERRQQKHPSVRQQSAPPSADFSGEGKRVAAGQWGGLWSVSAMPSTSSTVLN